MVLVDKKGGYIINDVPPKINDVPPKKSKVVAEEKPVKKPVILHRTRSVGVLANAVHQWPQYPGGGDAFMKYLDKLGNEMVTYLPKGLKKAYVQVEFIVDKDGVPVNLKILKGMNDQDFIDELIIRMENMGTWKPAILDNKPVAKKMIQTITVEANTP